MARPIVHFRVPQGVLAPPPNQKQEGKGAGNGTDPCFLLDSEGREDGGRIWRNKQIVSSTLLKVTKRTK